MCGAVLFSSLLLWRTPQRGAAAGGSSTHKWCVALLFVVIIFVQRKLRALRELYRGIIGSSVDGKSNEIPLCRHTEALDFQLTRWPKRSRLIYSGLLTLTPLARPRSRVAAAAAAVERSLFILRNFGRSVIKNSFEVETDTRRDFLSSGSK